MLNVIANNRDRTLPSGSVGSILRQMHITNDNMKLA